MFSKPNIGYCFRLVLCQLKWELSSETVGYGLICWVFQKPLVSAEASGDHPIGQGQAGHLGQGLRQIEGVGYCDRLDIGEQVFA